MNYEYVVDNIMITQNIPRSMASHSERCCLPSTFTDDGSLFEAFCLN